jgi:hypothetical protein
VFDGKIEADGSAAVAVDGLTDPAKDPVHRPPGTPYHYVLVLQFKDSSAVGARTQTPRPCSVELSKLFRGSFAIAGRGREPED